MKPYYEDSHVTIYHADCREVLPQLSDIGVVLADPPYGVALRRGDSRNVDRVRGDGGPFDPSHLIGYPCVLWGANAYANRLPASVGWLVWDKTHHEKSRHSQAEVAWTNFVKGIRVHREAYHGFMRRADGWLRPTQKPVRLFKWILALPWTPTAGLVVDPYMGSGPAVVAAKDMGRHAVGIEIEERYCDIAANRCAQGVLDFEGAI